MRPQNYLLPITILSLLSPSILAHSSPRSHHNALAKRIAAAGERDVIGEAELERRAFAAVGETGMERRQLLPVDDDDETTSAAPTRVSTPTSAALAPSTVAPTPSTTSQTPPTSAANPRTSSVLTSSAPPSATTAVPTSVTGASSTLVTGTQSLDEDASTGVGSSTGVMSSSGISSSIVSQSAPTSAATRASTDAQGSVIYVTQIETLPPSSVSDPLHTSFATVQATAGNGNANDNSTSTQSHDDGGGLSTGAIVGISVVGGVGVLGIALFIIWKMKQKRFSGLGDDLDAIKWPELNNHGNSDMHLPLPAKPTGHHGFETDGMARSKTDLDGNPIGDDEYDGYSNYPVSYANSINGQPGPYGSNEDHYSANGYGNYNQHGHSHNHSGEYLGHQDSAGLDRQRSLGGTRAFESQPDPEMMEMTSAKGVSL